jgi:hypothetical protein
MILFNFISKEKLKYYNLFIVYLLSNSVLRVGRLNLKVGKATMFDIIYILGNK